MLLLEWRATEVRPELAARGVRREGSVTAFQQNAGRCLTADAGVEIRNWAKGGADQTLASASSVISSGQSREAWFVRALGEQLQRGRMPRFWARPPFERRVDRSEWPMDSVADRVTSVGPEAGCSSPARRRHVDDGDAFCEGDDLVIAEP